MSPEQEKAFHGGVLFALAVLRSHSCEAYAGEIIDNVGIENLKKAAQEGQDKTTLQWIKKRVYYDGKTND